MSAEVMVTYGKRAELNAARVFLREDFRILLDRRMTARLAMVVVNEVGERLAGPAFARRADFIRERSDRNGERDLARHLRGRIGKAPLAVLSADPRKCGCSVGQSVERKIVQYIVDGR